MNGMRTRLLVATIAAAMSGLGVAASANAVSPAAAAAGRGPGIDWLEVAANRNSGSCSQGQMYVEILYAVNIRSTAARVRIKSKGTVRDDWTEQVKYMEKGWMPGDQSAESYSSDFAGCVTGNKRKDIKVTITAIGRHRSVSQTRRASDRIWGC